MRHHTENYVIVCVSMLSSLIKWQRYSTSHINEDLMGRFLNSLYEQSVSGLYQDIQDHCVVCVIYNNEYMHPFGIKSVKNQAIF